MKHLTFSALALVILAGCSDKPPPPPPPPPPNPGAQFKEAMDKAKAVEGVVMDKAAADRERIDHVDR